jgi:16S rRNA (uracil1498-N3)-methyltransferase
MKVFILPEELPPGQFIDLSGDDHHYLARVRRVRVGDRFPGRDRRGGNWLCTVECVGPVSLRLRLDKTREIPQSEQVSIRLIQCLPKAAKMDLIVRQATEAGVQRLLPVTSRFCQVRLAGSGDQTEKKLERWRRIVRQSGQQSGAPHPPDIDTPRELESLLRELDEAEEGEIRLFFHPQLEGSEKLHRCLSKSTKIVTLVVGPEGGLSPEEVQLLGSRGFVPVTVGQNVLRTETAALYAVAAIQTVIHERDTWEPT